MLWHTHGPYLSRKTLPIHLESLGGFPLPTNNLSNTRPMTLQHITTSVTLFSTLLHCPSLTLIGRLRWDLFLFTIFPLHSQPPLRNFLSSRHLLTHLTKNKFSSGIPESNYKGPDISFLGFLCVDFPHQLLAGFYFRLLRLSLFTTNDGYKFFHPNTLCIIGDYKICQLKGIGTCDAGTLNVLDWQICTL